MCSSQRALASMARVGRIDGSGGVSEQRSISNDRWKPRAAIAGASSHHSLVGTRHAYDGGMRPVLMTALLGLLLAACRGGGEEPSPTPSTTSEPSFDRSVFATPSPGTGATPGGGTVISGTFSSDSIEGGCAFLEAADGTRYEVLYPEGWTVLRNPYRLQDPDGEIVASGGETVTIRGEVATDMASICMVGPIFRATEVVTIDR